MEEISLNKNEIIANTLRATKEKRKGQVCRVFQIKIQDNKLSKRQREELKMIFVEGKWCYNAILSSSSISDYDTKAKEVVHLDKDGNPITSTYSYLPQSIRQTIKTQIVSSIKTLNTLKKKGVKVGPLKFISTLRSINYKQYGVTHKILSSSKVKLQGVKGTIKVNGLEQIYGREEIEIANWKLLNTVDGYYINITTYTDKDKIIKKEKKERTIGVDFGCKTSFVTSDGEHLNFKVRESERIKRLERKLSKEEKGSKRYEKTKKLLACEYRKLSNQKKDLANKTIAHLCENRTIVIQDENLKLWHKSHFGKTVQHSILGRVKGRLIERDDVVVLSRYVPTTKLCRKCGRINKISLSDRVYRCACGEEEDRDEHAALNMVWLYENKVGVGRTKFKRGEIREAIDNAFALNGRESLNREADTL